MRGPLQAIQLNPHFFLLMGRFEHHRLEHLHGKMFLKQICSKHSF